MDNLADLSKDPKFQAADPAAKRAAFEDVGSRDPNYANENDITKEYIRAKFGVSNEMPATREKTSTGSALLHGAERGAIPSIGGLGGAAAGAYLGAGLGAFGGPAAFVTVPAGAVIGGLLGGLGAGYATNAGQDYVLSKMPETAKALGQDEPTRQLETKEHPYASFAGEIAPLALTMSPRLGAPVLRAGAGAFERIMSKPVVGRAFGGTLNAGLEAGRENLQGQPLDPYKIAMAAGTGAVFVKPNRLGRVVTGGAERVVGAIPGMGARGPRPAPNAAPGGVPPGGTVPPGAVPPSGAGPRGPTPPGKYAASINLERFDTPEDVKNIVRQSADRNDQWWESRRGTMTFDDIKAAALESGVTPETIGQMKPGDILNAENNLRARQINAEIAANTVAASKQGIGGTAVQQLEVLKHLAAFDIVSSKVSGAETELGRSLSANRIRVTGEAQARAAKMELERLHNEGKIDRNKLNELNETLKNPAVSEAEAQAAIDHFNESGDVSLDDIMRSISTLNDPVSVAKVLSAANKPTTWNQFQEIYYNAMLSNPTTHAANITSNALAAAFSVPETALAAFTGRGKPGETVSLGEAPARFFGLIQGMKEGGAIALKTAFSDTPTISDKTGQFNRPNAISGLKGRIIRTPGRVLLAADDFFKAINHRGEINATAFRMAKGEGLKGDAFAARIKELQANPTDAMLLAAQKAAKYYTFTTELGKTGKAAETMLNTPVMRPIKLILPFFRTPVNVAKYGIERTPLAFLGPQLRANLLGKNGAVAAQQARGRLAMGTAVVSMAMAYAMDGSITGSGPADPGQRDVLRAQGWRPYSIKIGNTYYSYQRIEPLSTLFGIAADVVNLNKDAKVQSPMAEGYTAEKINQLIATATNNITNKAWMQSLSNAIEAYNDPAGKGQGFIDLMAGSAVPGIFASLARVQDPYARDVQTPRDAILNRIPGMSQTLPYKRDIYGKAIMTDKPSFYGSPVATSPVSQSPVRDEIARLKMSIRPPERTAMGVKLTPQQYSQLQLNANRILMPMLQRRIAAKDWPLMNDEVKKVLIKDMFNAVHTAAAMQIVAQNKDVRRGYVTKKTELPVKMGIMKPIPQPPTQAERLVTMLKSAF